MKKILVTGAAGYIGSILVPKLLAAGYEIVAVDRFFFGNTLDKHKNLILIKNDARCLKEEYFQNIYAVIDLVAISNDPSGEIYSDATWQINYKSRKRTAFLAKKFQVKKYILPSSCSIYGFQDQIVNEKSKINPLTTYAKANRKAEEAVLDLANDTFCVCVLRQATVYGYSPRMRFDLAINGMTYGAYANKKLPLMRDGEQFRPMVHIQDTTDAMLKLLKSDEKIINKEIFNVGSDKNNYKLASLAKKVTKIAFDLLKLKIDVVWYGDVDHRSYKVDFSKIEKTLNWQARYDAEYGVKEILTKLKNGSLTMKETNITLSWYNELEKWHKIIQDIQFQGGILNIENK